MFFDPLLYTFVFLGLFTPGPNVIMLTASGVRFGFLRTLPHLFGVVVGVGITAGVTALGVGAAVQASPTLNLVLRLGAAGFILWMAWGLWKASARPRKAADPDEKPLSFVGAVLFQWINPKVWAVAFAASAGYSAGLPAGIEAARLATAFSSLNLLVCLFWTAAGSLLTALLSAPLAWKIFLRFMAVLLAFTTLLIFR
ncbi:LysE family translocator [Pararhodobacter aggregans]|uniref:LysE family translocator n=1 Tax=Pararhodobacter aggregans TaxID=404875 RepID=A0A2T7UQS0_9RHOB|nr:LysE family translocator [Pararhodobacter aggregans]PTX01878.1 threonine/homoserine/homoserine lactone efflux protein [Pararhodobacter aggregans]PVE47073.1 LysE family translocator [Pararhodobacter aggregans]